MAIAVYPGSFDPITFGHIDIIQRLSQHYEKMIVLVADSPKKNYFFSSKEREGLITSSLRDIHNVGVEVFNGLTVDYARNVGAKFIIRGIRAVADFEYEMAMANMNKSLCADIETMIVFASPGLDHLSSRMVKEVAYFKGPLEGLVPGNVAQALIEKMKWERS